MSVVLARPSPLILHRVQAGIVVGAVDDPIAVDENVGRLDDTGAIRPSVDQPRRLWRHESADFCRPVLIANIENPNAGILISRKNEIRADKAARPVFMEIMRPEMTALADIIRFIRRREGRDADRIVLLDRAGGDNCACRRRTAATSCGASLVLVRRDRRRRASRGRHRAKRHRRYRR